MYQEKYKVTITTTELGVKYYPVKLYEKIFFSIAEIEQEHELKHYFEFFPKHEIAKEELQAWLYYPLSKHNISVDKIFSEPIDPPLWSWILVDMFSQYAPHEYNYQNFIKRLHEKGDMTVEQVRKQLEDNRNRIQRMTDKSILSEETTLILTDCFNIPIPQGKSRNIDT